MESYFSFFLMYVLAVQFGLVNTSLVPASSVEVGWVGGELSWEGEGKQEGHILLWKYFGDKQTYMWILVLLLFFFLS